MVLGGPVELVVHGVVTALHAFTSSWGREWEPVDLDPAVAHVIGTASGRSSNGMVPLLIVENSTGALAIAPRWSGSWRIQLDPGPSGLRIAVSIAPPGDGAVDAEGAVDAGGAVARKVHEELPPVSLAWGATGVDATAELARLTATSTPRRAPILTEWNHWWPYEDVEIDEDTFLAEAEVAAGLGLEIAVLDAGWFGASSADSSWHDQRGDWHS